LEFKLDSIAAKQIDKLTFNAEALRLSTPSGLQLGIVSDNTLVGAVTISGTIPGGRMVLSYMYNKADVENLKKNFDKAGASTKARK
jgi:hypothetical protein